MSSDIDPPDDDLDALAGEYWLGLLPPDEAAATALRMDRDASFAAAVDDWATRMMPLVDGLPPATPPATVWAAIAAKTAAPSRAPRGGVSSWRLPAFAVGVAAFAAVLFFVLRPAAPTPLAVATLVSPSDGTFVATAERRDGTIHLIIDPQHVTMPAGRVGQLWAIMPGAPPQPLGVLDGEHVVDIAYQGAPLNEVGLAVSMEPPGGSPTGLPTGPVIASAKFSSL